MDMTATTNNSTNTGITTNTTIGANTGGFSIIQPIKSPEAESETPPRIQSTKPTPFTNGVLKRHKQHHTVVGSVSYKECLKNHAASLGGHALDGCGEFMPAPNATATDPTSLKCAACGCHRNFHRREPEEMSAGGGGGTTTHVIEYHPHHRHHPLPPSGAHLSAQPQAVAPCRVQSPGSDNNSPPPISSTYYPGSAPHMLLALSSGGGTPDDTNKNPAAITTTTNNNINNGNNDYHHHNIFGTSPHMPGRKRFRTKFTQEQKHRMYEFAEKVGWKMQKSNEALVNGFCNEIGVERGVFKVWMHNNKNTLGKRSGAAAANYGISANRNQGGISIENINDPLDEDEEHDGIINGNGVGNSHSSSISNNHHHHHQQYNGRRSIESNAVPTNGSSCSS